MAIATVEQLLSYRDRELALDTLPAGGTECFFLPRAP